MKDAFLRGEFFKESLKNLSLVKEELKKLKVGHNKREVIECIFRYVHTLKGSAGFMGFHELQLLAHKAEDQLENLRRETSQNSSIFFDKLSFEIDNCCFLLDQLYQNEKDISKSKNELNSQASYTFANYLHQISLYIKKLAIELNKDIVFEYNELDNSKINQSIMVNELNDIILLIVNNACIHGIEKPQERLALGKSSSGIIKIKSFIEQKNIHIELEDDGRGICSDEIRASVLERKLMSETELKHLSTAELYQLLFMPDFSLSQDLSYLSGRGFGMDIIKNKVEAIGGGVSFESKKYLGSKYCIALLIT